ncbi:MAG: Gfo/Idh/MocA family oxidoreductase [Clostridiales bacterium]|jgi:predicted dehydrogenase|nr:Gfo/Idh/MocA family oxidoreductase [Clostridiales bacterium]
MNEKNPIRIGIVGLGRAGNGMHAPELRNRSEKFVFYAACDLIPERTTAFQKEFGSIPYGKYEDMLADPNVELVDIATRSCDHFRQAKAALFAGKDVFLEKPFCLNVKDARELVELGSKKGGPHLYVRHNRRFEQGFKLVNEIIESGILGNVYEIRLARNGYSRRDDWQTLNEFGGGQLNNWGPHIIDHSLRFCGGAYTSLYSELRLVAAAGDAEDHLKLVFTGVNGRIVDMEISGGVAIAVPEYIVYGSKGALISEKNGFYLRYLDPGKQLPLIKAIPETPGTAPAIFTNQEQLSWIEEHRQVILDSNTDHIWDALYDAIRLGKPFPITSDQALSVIEVIEEVKNRSNSDKSKFDVRTTEEYTL